MSSRQKAAVQKTLARHGVSALVQRATETKTGTYGTARAWETAHTYSKCLLWAETQRGTESTIGGREESLKRFKAAMVKDDFSPEESDRLVIEGQAFEITGSNLGAVDDFCLAFDLVRVEVE